MEIKILGSGCPKCRKLEQVTREAVEEAGVEASFGHVTDMSDILSYDITMTPGLVIDGVVKSSGRIPPKHEIAAWIQEAAV